MSDAASIEDYILKRYDELCDWPEVENFYGESDFLNFGYFEADTTSQREACDNLMEQLLDWLPRKGGSILDVACGKGETTAYLKKYFDAPDIVGINISENQLSYARTKSPDVDFRIMSATDLTFEDNAFDSVICVEAAFHFFTRNDFLKEALRVLKPGGTLVLCDVLMTMEAERERESRTELNYLANPDDYAANLREIGFDNVQVEDITEQSWRRHFWYAVKYFHAQYIDGKISEEQLVANLRPTYARVPDMMYYLKASGSKPRTQ